VVIGWFSNVVELRYLGQDTSLAGTPLLPGLAVAVSCCHRFYCNNIHNSSPLSLLCRKCTPLIHINGCELSFICGIPNASKLCMLLLKLWDCCIWQVVYLTAMEAIIFSWSEYIHIIVSLIMLIGQKGLLRHVVKNGCSTYRDVP
jgi:hypothetical protein